MTSFLEETYDDLIGLNDFNSTQITSLMGIVTKFLSNPKGAIFQTDLVDFAEANNSVDTVSLKSVVRVLLLLSRLALKEEWTINQLRKAFETARVNETVIKLILDIWQKKYKKDNSVIIQQLDAENHLLDLEWSYGLTLASDELNEINIPFIQLKFAYSENGQRKSAVIEMNLDQFYFFLAQMEKAVSYLDLIDSEHNT